MTLKTYPTREYLDLVFAYFGDGEPPLFPPFPHRTTPGLIQVWNVEQVPCNYLQSFENSMDEVHVAFTHQPGGSHAKLSADLPIITAEETDWGMLRFGTRRTGKVRQTLHYAPNVTRVIVPPLAGMDGVGGWSEIYFSFMPVDDERRKRLDFSPPYFVIESTYLASASSNIKALADVDRAEITVVGINGSTTILYDGLPIRPDPAIWWSIVEKHRVRSMLYDESDGLEGMPGGLASPAAAATRMLVRIDTHIPTYPATPELSAPRRND